MVQTLSHLILSIQSYFVFHFFYSRGYWKANIIIIIIIIIIINMRRYIARGQLSGCVRAHAYYVWVECAWVVSNNHHVVSELYAGVV